MFISVPKTTFLGLRTPTRRGGEILSKPKYWKCICEWKGHWSRTCYTPKHLVELYQKYRLKSEVHLMDKANPIRETIYAKNTTQLEINVCGLPGWVIELRYFYSYLLLLIIFWMLLLLFFFFFLIIWNLYQLVVYLFIQIIFYCNIYVVLLLFSHSIHGHNVKPSTWGETKWKYVFSRWCNYALYQMG